MARAEVIRVISPSRVGGSDELVAHTVVEGEPWSYLPGILGVTLILNEVEGAESIDI